MSASWPADVDVLEVIEPWLRTQRWFPGPRSVPVRLLVNHDYSTLSAPLDWDRATPLDPVWVSIVRVGEATVQVPLVYTDSRPEGDAGVIARVRDAWLVDGPRHAAYLRAWVRLAASRGTLGGLPGQRSKDLEAEMLAETERTRPLGAEQSNSSVLMPGGARPCMLKIIRVLQPGPNPDLEIPSALARAGWDHVATPVAHVDVEVPDFSEPACAGIATALIADATDGFELFRAQALRGGDPTAPSRDLGRTIADMHEQLTRAFGERDRLDSRDLVERIHTILAAAQAEVPDLDRDLVARLERRIAPLRGAEPLPTSIRIHGDLHLGQTMLAAGRWYVLDFEGEPLRPLATRRRPDLALRDVAGMIRSFDYALSEARREAERRGVDPPPDSFRGRATAAFLDGYTGGRGLSDAERTLLDALVIEKATYETVYEHRLRPTWVGIPLSALRRAAQSA